VRVSNRIPFLFPPRLVEIFFLFSLTFFAPAAKIVQHAGKSSTTTKAPQIFELLYIFSSNAFKNQFLFVGHIAVCVFFWGWWRFPCGLSVLFGTRKNRSIFLLLCLFEKVTQAQNIQQKNRHAWIYLRPSLAQKDHANGFQKGNLQDRLKKSSNLLRPKKINNKVPSLSTQVSHITNLGSNPQSWHVYHKLAKPDDQIVLKNTAIQR